MILKTIPAGPLEVNCHIIGSSTGDGVLVIDPGGDSRIILDWIAKKGKQITGVIATHGHFDHVGGVNELTGGGNIPFYIHEADLPLLRNVTVQAAQFGLDCPAIATAPHFLADNATLPLEDLEIRVIHTPGHSPGCICLYCEAHGYLITGDTLFRESVGRTDLPGGDFETLVNSITRRLMTLPDTVTIHPGHGPASTLRHERINNPFI
ncbi:MAG TPA: MBL fold metallo-hydrolase [bacterium]|nr:MBL fold metallo-hydrolase [bacterium]